MKNSTIKQSKNAKRWLLGEKKFNINFKENRIYWERNYQWNTITYVPEFKDDPPC